MDTIFTDSTHVEVHKICPLGMLGNFEFILERRLP